MTTTHTNLSYKLTTPSGGKKGLGANSGECYYASAPRPPHTIIIYTVEDRGDTRHWDGIVKCVQVEGPRPPHTIIIYTLEDRGVTRHWDRMF